LFSLPNELRWLLQRSRRLLPWQLASLLCIATASLLSLLTPLVLKWLIDDILPQRQTGLLLAAVLLIFVSHQCRIALLSLGNYLTFSAAQRIALWLRLRLLRHVDSLSADFYDSVPVGAVTYHFKEPLEEISYFSSDLLPAVARMLLTSLFTLATMFMLSPLLTMVVLPLLPVFLMTRHRYRGRLAIDSDSVQLNRLSWNTFLEEHLSSIIPIQLLRQEKRQERKAFRLLALTIRSEQKLFRTGVWFALGTSVLVVSATTAALGLGGWSVLRGTLSTGSVVAFYSYIAQLFDPLSGAAELYSRAQKTFASVRRVQAVLAHPHGIKDSPLAVCLAQEGPADIAVIAVKFSYPTQNGMLNIPFLQIRSGEHIAIAGENGAGKSTLAKLIARIYDVTSGTIRIGGNDIRSIRLDSLRQQICYLAREPVLFDGTMAFNLRFARPGVSDDELEEVIRCADLSGFVQSLRHGLGQRIGPGGCQLSGGQRQRLAIARALLQHPQVLILDEATSCLDPASESLLLHNLCRLRSLTVIVITHRVSTASGFSRVIAMAGGRIVADGGFAPALSGESSCRNFLSAS
jgi:ABC-type bacteriocin/lantibiotic exporter with double-glycine peptidase domain